MNAHSVYNNQMHISTAPTNNSLRDGAISTSTTADGKPCRSRPVAGRPVVGRLTSYLSLTAGLLCIVTLLTGHVVQCHTPTIDNHGMRRLRALEDTATGEVKVAKSCDPTCDGISGTCDISSGTAVCKCNDGYSHLGTDTETCIDACDGNCLGDGEDGCTTARESPSCVCANGYKLTSDFVCEAGNPCDDVTCSSETGYKGDGECLNVGGVATCSCADGYVNGTDATTCATSSKCGTQVCVDCDNNDGTCDPKVPSACHCKEGYVNIADGSCVDAYSTTTTTTTTTTTAKNNNVAIIVGTTVGAILLIAAIVLILWFARCLCFGKSAEGEVIQVDAHVAAPQAVEVRDTNVTIQPDLFAKG